MRNTVRGWVGVGLATWAVAAGCSDPDAPHQFLDAGKAAPDATAAIDAVAPPPDAEVLTVTCGAPRRLDTAGNNVVEVVAATISPGKYVVSWTEAPSVAPQLSKTLLFDGAKVLTEQACASPAATQLAVVAADGQGRAYAAWTAATGVGRAVVEPAADAFATPTAAVPATQTSLAGLSGGGAVLLGMPSGPGGRPSPTVSIYEPGTATWRAPETLLDGNYRYEALATGATGKAAVSWLDTFAPDAPLYVSTFDGATWHAPRSTPLAPVGAGLQYLSQTPAVLASGDVLFVDGVYPLASGSPGASLAAMRYHAATGVFDPPTPIDADGALSPRVFVDALDRVTVVYVKAAKLYAARDLGAGFTAPVELGAGIGAIAAIDAVGDLAVVLQPASQSGTSSLRRIAAGGTTWTDPVATGFGPTNGAPEKAIAIAFDGARHPVIFAKQIVAAHSELQVVVCQ